MMHRLAHIVLFSVAFSQYCAAESNLRTATTPSFASSHQHRDLSASGFWYTLLNLLHVPCPPNHTDDKPLGHCAHPSHKPKAPKKKSGGSSSSSSSGSSSSSSSSSWGGDSYGTTTASTAAGWTGDSYTASTVKADAWSSGWTNYNQAIDESQNSSSGNSKSWGTGTMCAALVGTIAFMVFKKRNQSADEDPIDVYVEADGNQFARNGVEDGSRIASITTSLSRGIRSTLGRENLDIEISNYRTPV